jgi:hypothetical protein
MLENFIKFFVYDVTTALLDALCGKGLLERNPAFLEAFGIFCNNLLTYIKRTPRVFKAREEVLKGLPSLATGWAGAPDGLL